MEKLNEDQFNENDLKYIESGYLTQQDIQRINQEKARN